MIARKNTFLLFVFNALLFLFLILFHYSGISIKISSANPISALALLVAIIMFSGEVSGVITGAVLGIILDSVTATPVGFNTVTLIVISFFAVLVSHYLFNRNLKSAVVLCLICAALYFAARWLVGFAFSGDIKGSFNYLLRYAAGSSIYTALFVIPFYYIEKRLFFKFGTVR
ncbi:MAG: rod shape-determining protein MreD [Clostridia bacterium]|nr:rod shape-determining protein MreD [Clostridia bacterium]